MTAGVWMTSRSGSFYGGIMETLFIVFAFIGMFASGFFACMLIAFALIMFKQDEQLNKRTRKTTDNHDGGDNHDTADNRTQHRS